MSESAVKIDIDGPVATVTLNKPATMNAMDKAFFGDIKNAFEELDDNASVRVIILNAEGKHFTAGLDLSAAPKLLGMSDGDAGRVREKLRRSIKFLQASFSAVEKARQPVIAAIHGACIGAGVDLVSAADIRLTTDDAWFSIKEVDIGIVADVGTLQRCTSLLPGGVLRELALTGRKYPAAEAVTHGFVNRTTGDKDALMASARELAAEIAEKSPLAVTGTKAIINHARDNSVDESLDYVATWNSGQLISEDVAKAGMAAMTKTAATFDDLLGEDE